MRLWSRKRSKVDSNRLQVFVESLLMYTKGVRGICFVLLMEFCSDHFFLSRDPVLGLAIVAKVESKGVREGWQGE